MSETIFSIFEGVCPDPECGGAIVDVMVECHPDMVNEWSDQVAIKENDRMAPGFSNQVTDDWIRSRTAVYTCRCSVCDQSYYLERNQYGDWLD